MKLPARRDDDENTRKLGLAPNYGPQYLQHSDGSWSVVGLDGWPVELDDYVELAADVISVPATLTTVLIDVHPIDVRDTEIR
ncbi:hypothetical protein ACIA8C_41235 [Nocardia sp. NPDC051321]|uniref:hypothetical protein n=1 Tax=Nocardia sp. NPDC051321 TaxID=3364323 RepID=UPI0037952C2F